MQRICNTLTEAHFSVTLLGRERASSKPLKSTKYQQHRLKCWVNSGPIFYFEINIRLFLKLFELKPKVVNSIDADTILAVGLYRMFRKFKWVHDAHELFTEVPEVVDRPFIRGIWLKLEAYFLPKADFLYTVSSSVAVYYKKVSKKDVVTIRNLPIPRLSNVVKPKSENSTEVILLYQGALNEGRCIEMYIQAMHHLDAVLWIVGEGDLSSFLRRITVRENLQHKVLFKGWIQPDELRQITGKAFLGLNVLEKKGLSYYNSLSNKCLDYIQAGVPSINSAFPEYIALDKEFGVFAFAEPTVESITKSIKLLLNDCDVYDTLQKNCNIAAQYLVWTTEKEKLLAIYEETR